ncbi:SGNH/GDSL hydrolase family protein [Streptomyces spectabilis]|uniref:Lysophospholipase L1-like esterase n=1 Tax=Streptomyces spectabilis TaxID=68270 RepID=A0A5P2X7G8_STRST|nr:SGNH/GDSL hydrolase family protein [Streptomyces spectabilis]MBB5108584.1 lysophospholipase L1-like esterase [Streptomyces spectabilis]MCI3901799.1 SGNH/GDSL hydrolase family protein [Streptomyces spectabilis]QEV59229.1 SGNH/GDSL hydrolase family protein [Streptomyces spectabilis]GGV47054.1 lysophospholipase [Streptomyces spectabilis]
MTSHPYARYVAVGDSRTEGLGDGDEHRGYRGWADRLAEILAVGHPDFSYANLAVRGRVTEQVRDDQLPSALALKPDLATVVAGVDDLVGPGYDAARTARAMEEMFAELTGAGACVATVTIPDIGRIAPLARRAQPRVMDLNARIRAAADRHGVVVLDLFPMRITADPRLWSRDRMHASPLGHALIAEGVADALGVPGYAHWARPLPPLAPVSALGGAAQEVRWLAGAAGPWVRRRARRWRVPRNDGHTAKRPGLDVVTLTERA